MAISNSWFLSPRMDLLQVWKKKEQLLVKFDCHNFNDHFNIIMT